MIAKKFHLHYLYITYVFDVTEHDWTNLNTAVCRGDWEIKDCSLEPEVDWSNVYLSLCIW